LVFSRHQSGEPEEKFEKSTRYFQEVIRRGKEWGPTMVDSLVKRQVLSSRSTSTIAQRRRKGSAQCGISRKVCHRVLSAAKSLEEQHCTHSIMYYRRFGYLPRKNEHHDTTTTRRISAHSPLLSPHFCALSLQAHADCSSILYSTARSNQLYVSSGSRGTRARST